MSTRTRPEDCCTAFTDIAPLPPGERERSVGILKALADPTRLEMYRLITGQPAGLCACDIVDRFDLAQPTIAHHLKVLRDAGLVTVSRRGIWAYYAGDPQGQRALHETLASLTGGVLAPAR
jgi:ArsR family transcriptional regulator, arsenate/arsenite/antimonite-responsive transcriptional repressor